MKTKLIFFSTLLCGLMLALPFSVLSNDEAERVARALVKNYYAPEDGCNRYAFYSNDAVSDDVKQQVGQMLDKFSTDHEGAALFLWSEYKIVNDPARTSQELHETTLLVCKTLSNILLQKEIFVLRVINQDLVVLNATGDGELQRSLWFGVATTDDEVFTRHCVTEQGMLDGLGVSTDAVYTGLITNFIKEITECNGGSTTVTQGVRFLASVSVANMPGFQGNTPQNNDAVEDYAGLPSDEKAKIQEWLNNFGASAKIFITSEKTARVDDLTVSKINAVNQKFTNSEFDGKDMAVWLHYDEENQKVHIKHAFGKNVLRINPRYESIPNHVPTSLDELTAISNDKVNAALQNDDWMKAPAEKESLGFIQSVVAVKDWTKDILSELQVPQNMWNDELGKPYQSSPVNIFPYIGGLGDGTFEELKSLPELVVLGIDVAIDKPLRDKMITSVMSLSVEDVKKMAVTMYTQTADIYSKGGPKAGHQGGKHTIQIATIVLPITKAGKLKKGAELAEEGMDGMADLLRKISKELQSQVAGISDEAVKRKLIKDLTDDTNLLKAFEDAILEKRNLVDGWKRLQNAPDGIRKGIKSLTTVSRFADEGIELTFEAIEDGARILNKNGDEVGKLLKEGSDEILEISDDFIGSAASSISKKFDGITIRSSTGETFRNAGFVKNADGTLGFIEDVSSYGSQAVQNTIKQRGALRASLTGIKATEDAHHIIPVQLLKENDVVKKAVEAGFDFNNSKNGLAIEKFVKSTGAGRHGPHPQYTDQIRKSLESFRAQTPNFTSKQAKDFLDIITADIKNTIQTTTSKINDLNLGL